MICHTKVKKKAFSFSLRMSNKKSQYEGKFDINLFKLIRDDFSNNYTLALEFYFKKHGFPIYANEFYLKVSNDYHYIRSILLLYPDSTSNLIQRRILINIKANYDNNSPLSLPIYFVCCGIKNAELNNLDMSIYDYEKAFEITSNERFTIHMPIDMNGNDILKTSHISPSISKHKFSGKNIYNQWLTESFNRKTIQ